MFLQSKVYLRCYQHSLKTIRFQRSLISTKGFKTITVFKNNDVKIKPRKEVDSIATIPNILTISRIACTPLIGHFILSNNLVPAFGLFTYCCITDFLDGYIARRYNLRSVVGTILDPAADKLLMIITTAAMSLPSGPQIIPLSIAALIIGRDFLLAASAIFVRFKSLKVRYGTVTWKSYWNFFKFPSVIVKPSLISKWNTFFQMIYLGLGGGLLFLESNIWNDTNSEDDKWKKSKHFTHQTFTWLGYIVGATTSLSGLSYAFKRNAVKFLPK